MALGDLAGAGQTVGPLVARVDVLDDDLHDAAVVERVALEHRRPLVFASLDANVGEIPGPAQRVVEGKVDVPVQSHVAPWPPAAVDGAALEEAEVPDVVGRAVRARLGEARALRLRERRVRREDRVERDLATAPA